MQCIIGKVEVITIVAARVGFNVCGIDGNGRLILLGKSGNRQAAKVRALWWANELRVPVLG